jgi:uncharacterized membrane protein
MTDAGNANMAAMRRTPRWMLVALFASLAVNLLVVGSVAGAVWRFRTPPPWASAVTPNLLGYASTLPSERRQHIWDQTVEERGHIRPFRRAVRAAREETIKTLVAEPFDRSKFVAAQTQQSEAENRARAAVQDLFIKIADNLSPQERHAFSLWREHRRPPSRNLLDEPDHQAGEAQTAR